jgi:beta-xylosidase
MKQFIYKIIIFFPCFAMSVSGHAQKIDTRWGDLGDGTFANPVLNADYSDPDIIRVGNIYYMTCSEFHFMGMNILESEDMVNWRIISRVYDSIPLPGYSEMKRYAEGTWAPSLRYHDGKFYIYVCTPRDGLFMTTATSAKGPWQPLYCVKAISGWEDPCPFWDDNGQAYLGHSKHGAGPIIVHRMSADGQHLLDDGKTVYQGPVAEGTKFLKKDGYYYLSIPEGGVGKGWQMVLRSTSIYGPYEGKRTLEQGSTKVNGPHQGSLVDTPEGEWWFYHFQETPSLGRVLHLEPVVWYNGYPFIGKDFDGNGVGEPVKVVRKPNIHVNVKPSAPQSSDDFNSFSLGMQWQFNHNPDNSKWSLSSRAGWLEIIAMHADSLRNARNQFTQKAMGYTGIVNVKLDYKSMCNGQYAGIECIGKKYTGFGVGIASGGPAIYEEISGKPELITYLSPIRGTIYLRLELDEVKNVHRYSYSFDDHHFYPCGKSFANYNKDWKGIRVGLYSYTTSQNVGKAFFDDFVYLHDGPK